MIAIDFINNNDGRTFWSHRPNIHEFILSNAEAQKELHIPLFFQKLHQFRVRSKTGENTPLIFITPKSNTKIGSYMLYGIFDHMENRQILEQIDEFKKVIKNTEFQEIYCGIVQEKSNSKKLHECCRSKTGDYWKKLQGGFNNKNIINHKSLDELFLDDEISAILSEIFNFYGDNYPNEAIKKFAEGQFGKYRND